MTSPASPSAESSHCSVCGGLEVVVRRGDEFAWAEVCPACQGGVCARCGGRGYTLVLREREPPTAVPCACRTVRERARLFTDARIPARYVDARIENFQDLGEPSLRAAKLRFLRHVQKVEPGIRGIGLSGPVGTGKTHLMCGFVRDCTLIYGVPARFIEFTHLLTELKRGYEEQRSGLDLIEPLIDVPVLVIDELGKGLATEWQLGILDELVSRRYNRGASLFFTTNFPFEARPVPSGRGSRDAFAATALSDRVGPRIFSRLCESCDLLRMEGDDYRATRARGAHG